MRIIGIDPGLQATGWGVIASDGAQLKGVSHGIIRTNTRMSDPERLILIFEGLQNVIANHQPETAIVEEIFVKDNPRSALRLGLARGVAILACGQARLALSEISARKVKQAVTGTGAADKKQVANMVSRLLGIPPPIGCSGCVGAGDSVLSGGSGSKNRGSADARRPVCGN